VLAVLFSGFFVSIDPAEVSVADVSIISEAEYAALTPPAPAPETQAEAPSEAIPPQEDAPPESPDEDTAPQTATPDTVEPPDTPDTPEIEIPSEVPQAAVVDDAPEIDMPDVDVGGTSLERDVIAAPSPRVAQTPSIAPPPDAEVAPEVVENTAPDPDALPEDVVEEQDAAAPEEASDRIVTEAEVQQETAPASSMRPRSRPSRPVRQAEPAPATDDTADAIAAAVSEANDAPDVAAPSGPPLTGGEKDAFRLAVSRCWNVGSLSTDALSTTVIVGFDMLQSGKPVNDSIRMVSFSGGSEGGARQAFEAARRAIIRCGVRGFDLPVEKYAQWREIEATFNPEGMQFR